MGVVQGHWLKFWQLDHLVCNPMWLADSVGEAIMKVGFPLILLYSGHWALVTGKQIQWPSRGSLHHGWVKPQIPSITLGTMFLSEAPEAMCGNQHSDHFSYGSSPVYTEVEIYFSPIALD